MSRVSPQANPVIVPANQQTSGNESPYSIATNYLIGSVNPRTGELSIKINPPKIPGILGMDVDLSIQYAQSDAHSVKSVLGLPPGWFYKLSYIADNQLNLNGGAKYFLSPETSSGLQYYKLKDLQLISYGMFNYPKLPYDTSENYAYQLKFHNGKNQYFDANGRLIAVDDIDGNHLLFYYDTSDQNIYNTKLIKVIDSFGQIVTITYSGNNIQINYPNNGGTGIVFTYTLNDNNTQLLQYTNPLGEVTTMEYNGGIVRQDLISKITYPTLLINEYQYATIQYLSPQGNMLQRDVIQSETGTYKDESRITSYDFTSDGNGFNYLGFPTYNTKNNGDALIDSFDSHYIYTTKVDNGVTITTYSYNYLHLKLQEEIRVKADNNIISQTKYLFTGEGGEHYFPPFQDLPPNYQAKKSVTTQLFNETGQSTLHQAQFTYNDFGQVTAQSQLDTDQTSGNLVRVSTVISTYDDTGFGLLLSKQELDYKPQGIISSTPSVRQIQNTLDAEGKHVLNNQVGWVNNPNDNPTFAPEKIATFQYDQNGRVTSKKLTWDKNIKNKLQPLETSYTNTFQYNPSTLRLIVTKTDNEKNATISQFDTISGKLVEYTTSLGDVSEYTYDALGRRLSKKDPVGNTITWSYDDVNNKITKEQGTGYKIHTYYNGFGNKIKHSDNLGAGGKERMVQTRGYDDFGRLSWVCGILGNSTKISFGYNNRGMVASKTDALGNITSYTYDSVAKTKTTFFNNLQTKKEQYNNYKKKILSERYSSGDKETALSFTGYNSYNNKVYFNSGKKGASLDWTTEAYSFDASKKMSGRVVTGWDDVTLTETYVRDLFNKITEKVNVSKTATEQTLNAASSILYNNPLGLLKKEENPLGQIQQYEYDSSGNNTGKIGFDSRKEKFSYYPNGKIKEKSYLEGNGSTQKIHYTYYENSDNVKTISNSNNETITYEYELDGKVTKITYPDGKTISWVYDNEKNCLDHIIDIAGNTIQYSYDPYGRLTGISCLNFGVSLTYYTQATDASNSGRLQTIQYSNGILVSLTYNGFSQLKEIKVTNPQKDILLQVGYAYSENNQTINSITYSSAVYHSLDVNHISNYGYNSNGKLITEVTTKLTGESINAITFAYDAAGNVLSRSTSTPKGSSTILYTYDSDNKLLSVTDGSNTYTPVYDSNGNITEDGFGNVYAYNSLNQLIGYSDARQVKSVYTYYSNGLRRSKKVADSAEVFFYYDHDKAPNIINETQRGITTSYVLLGSLRYVRIIKDANGPMPQYIIHDKKDILLTIDQHDQNISTYNYSAYGNDRSFDQENASMAFTIQANPFKYSHEYQDIESGLYYLRARYYSPHIMRFINRDSIQIFNHYSYAEGNPVMMTDKTGHTPWWNWLLTGLTFLFTAIVTVVSFGAAAPAAAAADAAEIGGIAADAGVTAAEAGEAGEAGSAAIEGSAEASVVNASENTASALSPEVMPGQGGFDPAAQTLWPNDINPNGLNNNCFFCTAANAMGEDAPAVAEYLSMEEGWMPWDLSEQAFYQLNLSQTGEFDITTDNAAEAFDFMARQEPGTRFGFNYQTGGNVSHWVNAESEGPGNAVSLFDAQSNRPLFGNPMRWPNGFYQVIRFIDGMNLMDN